jgi:MFS family permease
MGSAETRVTHAPGGYRSLLAYPDYLKALAGRSLALLGLDFHTVALSILVLELTQSASFWGSVLMAGAIPNTFLMLFGGVLVDRYGSRTLMLFTTLVRTILVCGFVVLLLSGEVRIWHLVLLSGAMGGVGAVAMTATASMVPELLPREHLRSGNALWLMPVRVTRFVAPPLVAALLLFSDYPLVFAVHGAMALAAAGLFWRMRETARRPPTPGGTLAQIRDGMRTVTRLRLVFVITITGTILAFGYGGLVLAVTPSLAKLTFGAGPSGVALAFGAIGAGAVLSGLLTGVINIRRQGLVWGCSCFATGFATLAASQAPTLQIAAAFLFVTGAAQAVFGTLGWTLVHLHTPAEVRGRVSALVTLGVFGMYPLAYALVGLLGDSMGSRSLMLLGSLIIILSGLWALAAREVREA